MAALRWVNGKLEAVDWTEAQEEAPVRACLEVVTWERHTVRNERHEVALYLQHGQSVDWDHLQAVRAFFAALEEFEATTKGPPLPLPG